MIKINNCKTIICSSNVPMYTQVRVCTQVCLQYRCKEVRASVSVLACEGVVCQWKAQVLSCLSDMTAALNSFPPQRAKFCGRW